MDIDEAIHWLAPGAEAETREHLERQAMRPDGTVRLAWVWLALGDSFYRDDLYDRARACYREAYKSDTDDIKEGRIRASIGIGNTLMMEQDYLGAKDAYERALVDAESSDLQKCVAEAAAQLSEVERALGSLTDAEAHARRAMSLNIVLNREKPLVRVARSVVSLALYLDAVRNPSDARALLGWATAQLKSASGPVSTREAENIVNSALHDINGRSVQDRPTE
jgi:tetratricopeptide (TPR) repeat protein